MRRSPRRRYSLAPRREHGVGCHGRRVNVFLCRRRLGSHVEVGYAERSAGYGRLEHVVDVAVAEDRSLRPEVGIRHCIRVIGVVDVGDDVQDAIGDENVGRDDLGRVDKHLVADLTDLQPFALAYCFERFGISEICRHQHLATDDVVAHDLGQLAQTHLGKSSSNGFHGLVPGSKDSDVLDVVESGHDLGVVQAAEEGLNLTRREDLANPRGRDKHTVDDLDETTLKLNIVVDDRGPASKPCAEDHHVWLLCNEDILTVRDIGPCRVLKECRLDVGRASFKILSVDSPLKDVILEQRHSRVFVFRIPDF